MDLKQALALSVSAASPPDAAGEVQITRDKGWSHRQDRVAMEFTGREANWLGDAIRKAVADVSMFRALWSAGALAPYVAEEGLVRCGRSLVGPTPETPTSLGLPDAEFSVQIARQMTTSEMLSVTAWGASGLVDGVSIELPAHLAWHDAPAIYVGMAERDASLVPSLICEGTRTLAVLARARRAGALCDAHRFSWDGVEVGIRPSRPQG